MRVLAWGAWGLCPRDRGRAYGAKRRLLGTTRTLDSHACRLRHKLGVHGDRFVVNVWGVGYRLIDPVLAVAA